MPDISPHSIVEKGAKIARDVRIGAYCYIGPKVQIGPECVIENNVTLVGNTTIGPKCHLHPMAVVGAVLDGDESKGTCVIGEANSLREHVTVYAGTQRKPTTIGQDNLIMIACQVGAGATIGNHGIFANCTHIADGAIIEDYVRTSAFGFIDKGMTVGAYSFTAGYVHVDHDVPPYAMVQGSPYRVRGVNSHNLKQCGFGEEDIRALKRAFRELYNSTGQLDDEALARLGKDRKANPCVKGLIKTLKKPAGRKNG
ncbi:MAG: hypothetical protein K8S55_14965 [Phycisphaerae bacterium]|nr:hypothetical protein [Phycisphaerae bacterium]